MLEMVAEQLFGYGVLGVWVIVQIIERHTIIKANTEALVGVKEAVLLLGRK